VGYSPRKIGGTISGEVEWIGSTWLSRIGVEFGLHERFTVRGGIDQISFAGELNSKPAFGFSVRPPVETFEPVLHYSYILEPYSPGGIHLLSLNLSFK
jgi:hypothetical protein